MRKHRLQANVLSVTTAMLMGLSCVFLSMGASAQLIDAVAATVGDEVILYSEIMWTIAPLLEDLQRSAPTQAAFEQEARKAQREALELEVNQKILYREALISGLPERWTGLDNAVDEQLEDMRKLHDSNEAFMQRLQDAGKTLSELREELRKKILAMAMANSRLAQFREGVMISETEMADYYQEHKAEFTQPEQVKVRLLFLTADTEPASRARAKARMAALKNELELGADFAELARAHSQGPQAEQGGLLGWVARNPEEPELVAELDAVVFNLEKGTVSDIIETQYGFHLVTVEDKKSAGIEPMDAVLTRIEPKLRSKHAQERYLKWMTDLRDKSQVQVFPVF